jgi:predicted nucleic-acid-binding protein
MIALDATVLVRYLAQDDATQSPAATHVIENELSAEVPGYISSIVLAQLYWVLSRDYGVGRDRFADIARGLLSAKALRFDSVQAAWNALQAFEDGADFVAALQTELGA